MDISKALDEIELGWKETVKPAIEIGEFSSALIDIQNLNLALDAYLGQFTKYHAGPIFIARARVLQRELTEGSVHPKTLAEFEVYMRQTKLSVSTENNFVKPYTSMR